MDSYGRIDLLTTAVYSAYTYYQVYVNVGAVFVYKGVTMPSPTGGPVVINVTVNSADDVAGSSDGSGIALIGKKKPEQYAQGPAGQNGLNSDGTWSIKG
jgi:hypothetical protein